MPSNVRVGVIRLYTFLSGNYVYVYAGGPTFVPALLDESDLQRTSSLLVDCLTPPSALLGEGDLFAWERFVLEGVMNVFNSVSRALNLYETELGLRQRMDNRLR